MPLKVEAAGLTDVGRKRAHNEDSFSLDHNNLLFIVADGMGGHASGEVASQIAIETLFRFFQETNEDADRTWPYKYDKSYSYDENRLIMAIKLANKKIVAQAHSDLRSKGMGTTLVALFLKGSHAYVAHVGDSRIYVIRDSAIHQITEDHSLLNDYMKIKKLTADEIKNFPHKNVIVRALGMKDTVQVDISKYPMFKEDIFLLCSDGLSGMVEDEDLLRIVQENRHNLKVACQKLIDAANENGGKDNITVILAKIIDLP